MNPAAVEALNNVNMTVGSGEVARLVGPSGSDRSTPLKCPGAIIEPTSGCMTLGNELIYGNDWTSSGLRALANRPPVILADAPTAPLDSERALAVTPILNQMAQQAQTAIIGVTYDEKIIPTFKRIHHIRHSQTIEEAGQVRSL